MTAPVCYYGAGYCMRYVVYGAWRKRRRCGVRLSANTWLYVPTSRRLPAFAGDTISRSRRRLAAYGAENGLGRANEPSARAFFGLPVFMDHTIRKAAP